MLYILYIDCGYIEYILDEWHEVAQPLICQFILYMLYVSCYINMYYINEWSGEATEFNLCYTCYVTSSK